VLSRNFELSLNIKTWESIQIDIELKIILGEFKEHQKLPPIKELANQYGVGVTTMQKITKSLMDSKIIFKSIDGRFYVCKGIRDSLKKKHILQAQKIALQGFEYLSLLEVDMDKQIERFKTIIDNKER
jgi:DNA-binding transcriptional regulator YhcF (GntR family)